MPYFDIIKELYVWQMRKLVEELPEIWDFSEKSLASFCGFLPGTPDLAELISWLLLKQVQLFYNFLLNEELNFLDYPKNSYPDRHIHKSNLTQYRIQLSQLYKLIGLQSTRIKKPGFSGTEFTNSTELAKTGK